jgi:hypothetical protein
VAQRCGLCAHPRRAEIEARLRGEHNVSEIGRELGITRWAVMRHREKHLLARPVRQEVSEENSLEAVAPPKYPLDPQTAFLTSYAANGDLAAALKAGGILRSQFHKWQEMDEAFAMRFHTAEAEAIEALEAEARTRAVAGSKLTRRVYRHGLLYEEIHEWRPSDAMLTKLLQAHKPEKYGDKLTVTQTTVVKAIDADAWNSV